MTNQHQNQITFLFIKSFPSLFVHRCMIAHLQQLTHHVRIRTSLTICRITSIIMVGMVIIDVVIMDLVIMGLVIMDNITAEIIIPMTIIIITTDDNKINTVRKANPSRSARSIDRHLRKIKRKMKRKEN